MSAEGPWLPPRRGTGPGRLRLFCLPYAGGGSSLFGRWQAGLPADVEVAPVILPGRDRRMREPAGERVCEACGSGGHPPQARYCADCGEKLPEA